jgi:hypothetical protein
MLCYSFLLAECFAKSRNFLFLVFDSGYTDLCCPKIASGFVCQPVPLLSFVVWEHAARMRCANPVLLHEGSILLLCGVVV